MYLTMSLLAIENNEMQRMFLLFSSVKMHTIKYKRRYGKLMCVTLIHLHLKTKIYNPMHEQVFFLELWHQVL